MKLFFYLATICLYLCSPKAISAERTKIIAGEWVAVRTSCSPYSHAISKIKPELMSQNDAIDFDRFLFLNSFPFDDTTCTPHIYPELIKLYKDVKNNQFDKTKSNFMTSTFFTEFMGTHKIEFMMAWNKLDNPFDAIRFPYFLQEHSLIKIYNAQNKPIDDVARKFILNEYVSIVEKNRITANERIMKEEIQKKNEKQKDIDDMKKEVLIAKYNQSRAYYISKVIEKDEAVLNESEDFIKNNLAESKEDFYQKLVLACYEMNCPVKIKKLFAKTINGKLAFRKYNDISIAKFFIERNDFETLKKFISENPDFPISDDEVRLSASLFDLKILNYLLNTKEYDFIKKQDDRSKEYPLHSEELASVLGSYMNNPLSHPRYDLHFMSKNKKLKSNNVLGYVSLKTGYTDSFTTQRAELSKTPLQQFALDIVAFKTPSWNGDKVSFQKVDPVNLKAKGLLESITVFGFNEFENDWIKLINKNEALWVHRSQVDEVYMLEKFMQASSVFTLSTTVFYESAGGKKVDSIRTHNLNDQFELIRSQWVNNELWLNILILKDYNKEGDPADPIKGDLNLWIKAFENGEENFRSQQYNC